MINKKVIAKIIAYWIMALRREDTGN